MAVWVVAREIDQSSCEERVTAFPTRQIATLLHVVRGPGPPCDSIGRYAAMSEGCVTKGAKNVQRRVNRRMRILVNPHANVQCVKCDPAGSPIGPTARLGLQMIEQITVYADN